MASFVQENGMGGCFVIIPLRYCEYFKYNEQCRYCCLNPGAYRLQELGVDIKIHSQVEEIVESYLEAAEEVGRVNHSIITGGSMIDEKKALEFYLKLAAGLKKVSNRHFFFAVQAFAREDSKKLHDVGLDFICYPLEVWNEKLWPVIVPGKAKYIGRSNWLKRLEDAADI